jgi:diguanylate cyclase (GGDEF)-like protein
MGTAAERAFMSMTRLQGQFSLLLDERFIIVWHCESMGRMLGWGDLRGRDALEFVHVDDLEVVLATMVQVNRLADPHGRLMATSFPESADVRILDVHGAWHTFESTTHNHLDDPDVHGVLCTCRAVRDRSDVARSVELLGSGANIEHVLPVIARLADHSLGPETRTVFGWRHGHRSHTVTATGASPLDRRLEVATELVWSMELQVPLLFSHLDDDRLGTASQVAKDAGYLAAYLVPIMAPSGGGVIGAMIAWGVSTVEFKVTPQSPVHLALRLAALAIADSQTKRDLRWAAAHDPLTRLANRIEFASGLETWAAVGDVVLLYIDLDDFKPINDVHGHAVGDMVLVEVGQRILASIGDNDVVGRLGGDEFAVICTGTDDPVHGRRVADRIVRAIRQPITAHGIGLRVSASVGVAVGAQPLIPAQLMERADDALYQAKRSGKNTVRLAASGSL